MSAFLKYMKIDTKVLERQTDRIEPICTVALLQQGEIP